MLNMVEDEDIATMMWEDFEDEEDVDPNENFCPTLDEGIGDSGGDIVAPSPHW